MQREIPNSTLHIINAHGHCLHMTNPKYIDDEIKNFVQSHQDDKHRDT